MQTEVEKMREASLRHVERKTEGFVAMRIICRIKVSGQRKIGRRKLRWSDVIQKDLKETGEERRNTRPKNMQHENSTTKCVRAELG